GVDSGAERWSRALSVIALVAFVALALQVAARVKFPWDTFIWSESPFLTNMLSLNAGRSVYGPPSNADSFVYSPGLEYLCYAVLHPFGLDRDIRFCRGVVLAAGLTAAFAAARSGASLLAEIGTAPRAV